MKEDLVSRNQDRIISRYRCMSRLPKGVLSCPRISAEEALEELKNFFLGENWYVVDPLNSEQVNFHIVESIERMFPSKMKEMLKGVGDVRNRRP